MKNLVPVLAVTVAVLTACGGGGGSTPTPGPTPVATNVINTVTINSAVSSDLILDNVQNDDLFHDILAIGDVNGDGYDDVLVGVMRVETGFGSSVNRTVKPILLVFNPSNRNYEVSQEFKSVTNNHIWPRQAVIADFDGDGRNDIFIADTGTDAIGQECGYQNSLVLNTASGMVNATNRLPQYRDYSHALIAADFNKDKKTDLFVINSPYLSNNTICNYVNKPYVNRSYLITGGNFIENTLSLQPNDVDQFKRPILNLLDSDRSSGKVASSTDLNGDGFPDLVLGGNRSISIMESNGLFSYNKSQTIPAPIKYSSAIDAKGNCNIMNGLCVLPYTYVSFYDIDGDGQMEIIASLSNNDKSATWIGQYFQALKKINGVWTDITDSVFPNQNVDQQYNGGEWCYRMQIADFNGDGKLDILCSNYKSAVWTFNNNQFTKTRTYSERLNVVKFPDGNYLISVFVSDKTFTLKGGKI